MVDKARKTLAPDVQAVAFLMPGRTDPSTNCWQRIRTLTHVRTIWPAHRRWTTRGRPWARSRPRSSSWRHSRRSCRYSSCGGSTGCHARQAQLCQTQCQRMLCTCVLTCSTATALVTPLAMRAPAPADRCPPVPRTPRPARPSWAPWRSWSASWTSTAARRGRRRRRRLRLRRAAACGVTSRAAAAHEQDWGNDVMCSPGMRVRGDVWMRGAG